MSEHIPLKVGTQVQVGGCVGQITSVGTEYVAVEGSYHYLGGGEDPWLFHYKFSDISKVTQVWFQKFDGSQKIWDISHLNIWN